MLAKWHNLHIPPRPIVAIKVVFLVQCLACEARRAVMYPPAHVSYDQSSPATLNQNLGTELAKAIPLMKGEDDTLFAFPGNLPTIGDDTLPHCVQYLASETHNLKGVGLPSC
jgi:hypothetical protein